MATHVGSFNAVPYEGLEDTPGEALPALDYKPVFFFGERCIELTLDQERVLRTTLPAILHGAPRNW